jgi:multicomponent K+:H+ antiporter subunit C
MEILLACGVGVLGGAGVYLLLRARAFDTVLGLVLISYAVNLLLFFSVRSDTGAPPILDADTPPALAYYVDPLPQALVLTAIVIGFAMTALLIVIVIRMRDATGTDHVDGVEPKTNSDGSA